MSRFLNALFQPQTWVHDDAVDSGPAVEFDAGAALLSLDAASFRRICQEIRKPYGRDLDALAEAAGLVGDDADQHDGPFSVSVESYDLADFLFELGVSDLDAAKPDGPLAGWLFHGTSTTAAIDIGSDGVRPTAVLQREHGTWSWTEGTYWAIPAVAAFTGEVMLSEKVH